MRKKSFIQVGNKKYTIGELTVGLYWLASIDGEQFTQELLGEFNEKIPKLNEKQSKELLKRVFDIEEELEDLFKKKKKQNPMKDFHINVGIFMRMYPGNSYDDIMNTPLRVFRSLMDDYKIIKGDKEYDPKRNSSEPDKKGLKNLVRKI